MLQEEIQRRVTDAGLRIEEARITHLAYAPEIAAVMLQRQQAAAIIDARKMIVEGAVSMVEQALRQLSESHIVELDAERRARWCPTCWWYCAETKTPSRWSTAEASIDGAAGAG